MRLAESRSSPQVRRNAEVFASNAHATLVRSAYQPQSRAPFKCPIPAGFCLGVELYGMRKEIDYCNHLRALQTYA